MERRVLAGLVTVRLLAACSSLHEILQSDHLLTSPLTAFPRLREGVYLFKQGVDPYSGGVFRQSPILLTLFSTVLPVSTSLAPFLWTFCDGVGAWCLSRIWRLRSKRPDNNQEALVIASYLLNPYLFLPSLALSTSTFDNTLFLISLHAACLGNSAASLLALAFLTHMSPTSALLLPPILFLHVAGAHSRLSKPTNFVGYRRALPLAYQYFAYVAALALISTLVSGGWNWVARTWGAVFTLPELTPNPGLWWYFHTEMFDHFRSFFLMTFSMHLLIYVAPICIKFQHDPLYATFILQGIFATLKSYPTLSDPGLFLSMFAVFPEVYPYLRMPIVTTLLHLHACLLLPLFHRLWLTQGTGNANFFYASTLVFGIANAFAIIDAVWGGLRIAFGDIKSGWEVVQI